MSFGFCSSSMALAPVSPKGSCDSRGRSFGQNLAQLEIPAGVRYTSQSLRSLNESPLGCCYQVSPCSSPPVQDWMGRRSFQAYPRSSPRPDLAVACKASEDQAATACQAMLVQKQQHHRNPRIVGDSRFNGGNGGVPVYVMLPLDSIKQDNSGVNRMKAMNASFQALKSAGVEGIMVDVWWGLVEREGPCHYNWNAYRQLLDMVNKHGLKVQAVMSFHQCGGNVGDSVCIPLPKWVVEEMHKDKDLAYTDQNGRRNFEYVSLGVDGLPVLKGRTPIQCYTDFMKSFRDTFSDLMGDTIVEIQVGMGPAGELRYPSYPESEGTWRFPGIGAFQCYDKYMKADLKAAAERYGKPEWGNGGPADAGQYNNWPEDTPFFKRQGGWNSEYGEFFLSWYSGMLLNHGDTILSEADAVFQGSGAILSAKVAGIHWHYGTRSHAPELTAGYYNTRFRDGYEAIARMLAKYGVVFNFTCIEMRDHEQPQDAQCSPENLIKQVVLATRKAGVALAGENALPRFDEYAHNQIVNNANLRQPEDTADKPVEPMCAFTYLRMCPELFQSDNWRQFVSFVRRMSRGNANHSWDKEHREADQLVHESRPLVQEAAAFV